MRLNYLILIFPEPFRAFLTFTEWCRVVLRRKLFESSFTAVAVFVGAAVIYNDGSAGPDELVHAFPGFDPWADAEGLELSDGAFEIADEHLQKLFAVDILSTNVFYRGDCTV